jgi:chromate reductase, NAD(P)H dehydrogenase (quinone)
MEIIESINFLAISGSLRKASYNTAALNALKILAPNHADIIVFSKLGEIPLFNPDREGEEIPVLEELRRLIAQADGLIIASPEYAHGISGVLKNALDWLVSGFEFVNKPIMLINTSPRANIALDSLREIVKTMSGVIVESSCVSVPLLGSGMDCQQIVEHPEFSALLCSDLEEFSQAVQQLKINKSS